MGSRRFGNGALRRLLRQHLVLVMAVAACAVKPAPTGSAAARGLTDLSGQVLVKWERAVQATMGDVAIAATVSLLDASTNTTIATAVTDSSGRFDLSGFSPIPDQVYILEAIKGLVNNRPGESMIRVRTLISYDVGWQSLTGTTIQVSSDSTALAIIAAAEGLDGSTLLGHLGPGPDGAEPFTPTAAVDTATFDSVRTMVEEALTSNLDPVAAISYSTGSGFLLQSHPFGMAIVSAQPNRGSVGSQVTLLGNGFDPASGTATVTFNGSTASISTRTDTTVVTTVPARATTGPLVLVNDLGTASVPYVVVPGIPGTYATSSVAPIAVTTPVPTPSPITLPGSFLPGAEPIPTPTPALTPTPTPTSTPAPTPTPAPISLSGSFNP